MITNILLTGVGGQGILLAARIIASAAQNAGFDVTTNEIHGMAQRGGSVTAQIRYGQEVLSPLILEGTADAFGALEPIEALRYSHYLKPEATAVVASRPIIPITVSSGQAVYPDNLKERLNKTFPKLKFIDFDAIALEKFKNIKVANTILLGTLSTGLSLPGNAWSNAIAQCVKSAYVELNENAFEYGRNL
ncbi:MAG: indolepyruvate oxidoreductase subunit beta [Victivallales bacterium]|jgi:indolepyruvate ferredoxin oxidoreductase beta subunit|nr:indolepyruvate oxidoreductase subunit beta [Victivallales bacterium]